ncbi:MAG: helix-turn-helix domain-containing protein [Solirubrobacteraceae bacterium]
MPEIGETLREARMRRRIDMTEVEAATKIRAKYLRALESEEWELLPGPTFVKTFLRTYADYLELDSRLLVEEYKQRFERPAGMDLTPLNLRSQRRRRSVAPRIGPGVVVVLGVFALLAALYLLGRSGPEDSGTETPTRVEETPAPSGGDGERERDQRRERKRPRNVRVRIAATGPVYVCMEDGRGRPVVDKRTLEQGQSTRTFRGRRFRVTFGTANARMRVNGRNYPVATSQDPVGYELRAGRGPRRLSSGLPTCT